MYYVGAEQVRCQMGPRGLGKDASPLIGDGLCVDCLVRIGSVAFKDSDRETMERSGEGDSQGCVYKVTTFSLTRVAIHQSIARKRHGQSKSRRGSRVSKCPGALTRSDALASGLLRRHGTCNKYCRTVGMKLELTCRYSSDCKGLESLEG